MTKRGLLWSGLTDCIDLQKPFSAATWPPIGVMKRGVQNGNAKVMNLGDRTGVDPGNSSTVAQHQELLGTALKMT